MAMTKAAGLINTRNLLRAKGAGVEQAMLAQLTPQEVRIYQDALPVTQLPIELLSKVAVLSAPLLFPGQGRLEALLSLGRVSALSDLKGIYKILLRFTTPEFAMKQAARLWTTLHTQGEARCFSDGEKRIVFEVMGYPDLPEPMRQVLGGYILGMAELTGIRNARIALQEENPRVWRWVVTWG
ncbi:MAG: hypothetical protein AB1439_07360 [candidate division FCPU426 bacterium]